MSRCGLGLYHDLEPLRCNHWRGFVLNGWRDHQSKILAHRNWPLETTDPTFPPCHNLEWAPEGDTKEPGVDSLKQQVTRDTGADGGRG